ncbi:MAG: diacylglycerol kinase [Firmicutes bacterium HGW-Firmicutes-21]|nr:MAG: diacylglycerol kinase [Firmicutes bacterium HGW-Firmicutes-21]
MSERLLLIVNPRSGRGRARSTLLDIISVFTGSGRNVTVYPTREKEATITYVADNAPGYDMVVVCGGDGTLNEVINGVMCCDKRIPIGYIPLGSTNDFASSVHIPSDCVLAADKILRGTAFSYDIGSMNGNYFAYIACAGAFAETSYMTSQNLKNKLGHSAYLLSSVKSLSTLRKTTMTVTTPELTVTGDYLFAAFTNSRNVGGVLTFPNGEIVFNDGLFELLLIKMPRDLIEFSILIRDLLNTELNNKNIELYKASSCSIKAERSVGWSLDGEEGGLLDNINMLVHPKAVDIIL